jgi:hypothetical protein
VDDFAHSVEAALKKREPVIVILTKAHTLKLLKRLRLSGCDVAAAVRDGRYISLDVSDTLAKIMVNDWPDKIRFLRLLDDLLTRVAKTTKARRHRISACGECAPALLAQGNAEAAVALEKLWDGVARDHNIDILCGYLLPELL